MQPVAICADAQSTEQVETLLKTQDANDTSKDATRQDSASEYVANTINLTLPSTNHIPNLATPQHDTEQHMSGEIIGLGLEEPLPPQEVTDNLYEDAAAGAGIVADAQQIRSLLFQSSSLHTCHTQTTVSRGAQPRPPYATTNMPTIHHVGYGSIRQQQI